MEVKAERNYKNYKEVLNPCRSFYPMCTADNISSSNEVSGGKTLDKRFLILTLSWMFQMKKLHLELRTSFE